MLVNGMFVFCEWVHETSFCHEEKFSYESDLIFLEPVTKLGQGNIFRSVCQEFCPQGGSAPLHAGIHPPWDQTPPRNRPPRNRGRHPLGPDTP